MCQEISENDRISDTSQVYLLQICWGLKPESAMKLMAPVGPAGAESPVVVEDMASDQFR